MKDFSGPADRSRDQDVRRHGIHAMRTLAGPTPMQRPNLVLARPFGRSTSGSSAENRSSPVVGLGAAGRLDTPERLAVMTLGACEKGVLRDDSSRMRSE